MPSGDLDNFKGKRHELTAEDQTKGAKKSVEVRRRKKKAKQTTKEILEALFEMRCEKVPMFENLAEKMGVSAKKTDIKEITVMMSVVNLIKKGNMSDLAKLCEILGENSLSDQLPEDEIEDDPLTKALKEEAEKMKNADK